MRIVTIVSPLQGMIAYIGCDWIYQKLGQKAIKIHAPLFLTDLSVSRFDSVGLNRPVLMYLYDSQ